MAVNNFVCLCLCLCFQGDWASNPKSGFRPGFLKGYWNSPKFGENPLCKYEVESGFPPMRICKTGWDKQIQKHPGKPCIAYDIGVRTEAGFAFEMIEKFNCNVRAYDPSKTTAIWYDQDPKSAGAGLPGISVIGPHKTPIVNKLHGYASAGRYKLYREAAGDRDGDLTLYAFNWQQVTNVRATEETRDKQQAFVVKSKTLPSMMKDNGDTYIDVLKIDIEGSEFGFLNAAFDLMGCPPVEHIMLEWHSAQEDMDFEIGAGRKVLDLEKRMEKCGFTKYQTYPFYGQENAGDGAGFDTTPMYYGHACYCRTCLEINAEV